MNDVKLKIVKLVSKIFSLFNKFNDIKKQPRCKWNRSCLTFLANNVETVQD